MSVAAEKTYLMTGEEYKASLRDGREVWYQGQQVEDVTDHPATGGGISLLAQAYDDQHDPATQDILTFVRDDGARISKAWMIPRTKEDLWSRRESVEYLANQTFGIFGRQSDMISTTHIGLAAYEHIVAEHSPEFAKNILPSIERAGEENIMLAGPIADPQGWRSRGSALGRRGIPFLDTEKMISTREEDVDLTIDGKLIPGALRMVKESDEGIWISGAKIVSTVGPQAHELLVSNIALPDPTEDAAFWLLIPCNAPGVRQVCREHTSHPDASFHDHPIASRGEEIDALVIFEDVFVPRDRIMSYRWTGLGSHYGKIGAFEHWHTLTRIAVKAELYVGLLQLICDGIGTVHRPGVRQLIAEVIEYANVVRGMVLAGEERAELTESGVMWPDPVMITAGRSYALGKYPHIVHLVKELAGQGPILRWSDKDLDHPVLGPRIEWFYEGAQISARDKNILMNFLWDFTVGSHAGRVGIFENVNGFPVPYLRERLFLEHDREPAMDRIREYLGLSENGKAG